MVLLATVILPHGAMPYDGDSNSPSPAVRERRSKLDPAFRDTLTQLYGGICEAASEIAALQADLYIIHTPHGIGLSESYGIYGNTSAEGNALWLGQWSEFAASAKLDQVHAKELKELLNADGISTQLITCYGGSEDMKMRWGEAIPIWYLQKYITNEPKYLIISQDTKPRAGVVEDWRLNIGRKLATFVEGLVEKVVVVVSGDLSHCHATPCTDPMYLPSPTWHLPVNEEAAEAYEAAITQWICAGTPESWNPASAAPFLDEAVALDPLALSCGMKGFIMLHGLMDELVKHSAGGGATFRSRLVVQKAPTYYGMLAATFIRK